MCVLWYDINMLYVYVYIGEYPSIPVLGSILESLYWFVLYVYVYIGEYPRIPILICVICICIYWGVS